ncbi:uncharacterized protein LOC127536514 [Acanthochromis polyacanthus]|uniref:uncharacterized protein LOC127536514 n=1 Tax=Acanthochromis polyacanthus TaxID=80966 RepID=UPI00223434A2|nr:uncharacterized protein LOC127536514 [Acanthochromis polyacanthus]
MVHKGPAAFLLTRSGHSRGPKSTMKLFVCCLLLLPFANLVVTAPTRAQRENVLSFLTEAFGAATEKTVPANITAYRYPPSRPVKEPDSEDLSKNHDSDEIVVPEAVEKEKPPSRGTAGASKDDNLSREHAQQPASRDLTSEEEVMLKAQVAANVSGKRVFASPDFQAEAGGVTRMMSAPGRSREMLDPDSLEKNTGRLAAAVSSKHTGCDEQRPCSSSLPAKSRTT